MPEWSGPTWSLSVHRHITCLTCCLQAEGVEGVQEAAAALMAALVAATAEHCPGLGLVPPLTPDPSEGLQLHVPATWSVSL